MYTFRHLSIYILLPLVLFSIMYDETNVNHFLLLLIPFVALFIGASLTLCNPPWFGIVTNHKVVIYGYFVLSIIWMASIIVFCH